MLKVLIVDDDSSVLISLRTFLRINKITAITASSSDEAIVALKKETFDLALLDVFIGNENGIDLCKTILTDNPDMPIIMISGESDIEIAVKAVHAGAWDFLEKPLNTERLLLLIRNIERQLNLVKEKESRDQEWLNKNFYIGESLLMKEVIRRADKIAETDFPVLISGENGSGKDLLAHYIYLKSKRSSQAMITVNCAAVPEGLFESAFFGHIKGAFTGADSDKSGFFAQADKGTLFLDEIGEIPLEIQARLLRALENGEIQPVGSEVNRSIDVRIIAATNKKLEKAVKEGTFREDLYYRLKRLPLNLPSLNERREDIPQLITFLSKEMAQNHSKILLPDALDYLSTRSYSGNIRELRNILERIIVLSAEKQIGKKDLLELEDKDKPSMPDFLSETMPFSRAKKKMEALYLKRQINIHHGSIKETAEALDMLPNNLSRKLSDIKKSK